MDVRTLVLPLTAVGWFRFFFKFSDYQNPSIATGSSWVVSILFPEEGLSECQNLNIAIDSKRAGLVI